MSFRDNLQYLRAQRNMTQEHLAMLVGVSRQSVTKWEAERAYPEMDKLLRLCQIFEVSLDDLVNGDVAKPAVEGNAKSESQRDNPNITHGIPRVSDGPVGDVCGYDEHMRQFALRMSIGIAFIVCSTGLGTLVDFLFHFQVWLSAPVMFAGILTGLAFIIPALISHEGFKKEHPYIEDFYTSTDRTQARIILARAVVAGIACIFCGIAAAINLEYTNLEDIAPSILLAFVGVGSGVITWGFFMHSRVNVSSYNRESIDELDIEDIRHNEKLSEEKRQELIVSAQQSERRRRKKHTAQVAAIIMVIATIIALTWLFCSDLFGFPVENFWIPWPIGGLCCALASIIIEGIDRD